MATINLQDFYPWYKQDEFVDVPDVIAAELFADRRYHKAHEQRMRSNKAFYPLDVDDGIEASAIVHFVTSSKAVLEMKEWFCRLCCALNSLPETQGRRVEVHFLLGKSIKEIAEVDCTGERNIRKYRRVAEYIGVNTLKEAA